MKKITLLMIIITLISNAIYAQDFITFIDGSVKTVYIKEVSETEIKYRKTVNKVGNTGILYSVLKTSLFSVQYKNGEKEVFIQPVVKPIEQPKPIEQKPLVTEKANPIGNAQPTNLTVISSTDKSENFKTKNEDNTRKNVSSETSTLTRKEYSDMFQQGKSDAAIYYKGYKGAGTGTFFTSFLLGPIVGLIPAIACSSTSPSPNNLVFPSVELMKNPNYVSGYTQQAKAKKSGKAWGNYGIGSLLFLVIVGSRIKR